MDFIKIVEFLIFDIIRKVYVQNGMFEVQDRVLYCPYYFESSLLEGVYRRCSDLKALRTSWYRERSVQ